jgi:hypothetical protein
VIIHSQCVILMIVIVIWNVVVLKLKMTASFYNSFFIYVGISYDWCKDKVTKIIIIRNIHNKMKKNLFSILFVRFFFCFFFVFLFSSNLILEYLLGQHSVFNSYSTRVQFRTCMWGSSLHHKHTFICEITVSSLQIQFKVWIKWWVNRTLLFKTLIKSNLFKWLI